MSVVIEQNVTFNRANMGALKRIYKTISYAELTDADTSQSITIGIPSSSRDVVVLNTLVDLTTAFSDGASATYVLDVGTTTNPDKILDGADVATADDNGPNSVTEVPVATVIDAEETIAATFTSSVNLNTSTAGSVTISIIYSELL